MDRLKIWMPKMDIALSHKKEYLLIYNVNQVIKIERVKMKIGQILPYHGWKIDLACSLNKKLEDYVD